MSASGDMERMREELNPLGPARGVLIAVVVGALLWALLIAGAFVAMKGLA